MRCYLPDQRNVGPSVDAKADLDLDTWAGVIPLSLAPGTPIAAADLDARTPTPDYVSGYQRPPIERRAQGVDDS